MVGAVGRIEAGESATRTLLRVTTSSVIPQSTGGDPGGRALYAQWTEDGADTWTAASTIGALNALQIIEAQPNAEILHIVPSDPG